MTSMDENFAQIKALLALAEEDYHKFQKGNKTAGVRLRKNLKEVKDIISNIRKGVLEARKVS